LDGQRLIACSQAPFDTGYLWANDTNGMSIVNPARTLLNDWKGSITQEAASAVTVLDNTSCTSYGPVITSSDS
jgi:hypothetical protein